MLLKWKTPKRGGGVRASSRELHVLPGASFDTMLSQRRRRAEWFELECTPLKPFVATISSWTSPVRRGPCQE